jgi:hypothetical protein
MQHATFPRGPRCGNVVAKHAAICMHGKEQRAEEARSVHVLARAWMHGRLPFPCLARAADHRTVQFIQFPELAPGHRRLP